MNKLRKLKKNILSENRLLVVALLFLFVFSITLKAFATYPTTPFFPSEQENDPSCSPGDVNCYVAPIAIGEDVGSGTLGSVLFLGTAGILAQDNTNFFWDDTNNRLGLGTTSPDTIFDITGSGAGALFTFNTGGTNKTAQINFVDSSASKAVLGWDGPNARFELDTDEAIYLGDMATEDYYLSIERGSFSLTGGQTSVYNSTGTDLVVSADSDGVSVSPGINSMEMAIYSSAAGIMPLWINLATSQTANAITITDNSGGTLTALTAGGLVQASSGSITTPGFGFVGDTDNGLYRATTNEIGLVTAGAEIVRIDAAGEVGIGDTTPDFKLDVETDTASSSVASFFNDGNNTNRAGIIVQAGVDDHTAVSTSTLVAFNDGNGTAVGSITFGSSATAYNTTSDERLKDNIEDTSLSVNDLMNIQVRDYTWRADKDSKITHGFVAQELYEIYPSAVTIPSDPNVGYWMVDYSKLMPLTIKAIQDINISVEDIRSLSLESSNSFASRLIAWFADTTNGIGRFFAGEIHTDKLCVGETCVTEEEFLNLINQNQGGQVETEEGDSGVQVDEEIVDEYPSSDEEVQGDMPLPENQEILLPDEEVLPEVDIDPASSDLTVE